MRRHARFDEVLDSVEALPPDDQAELVEIVRRRLAERNRERLLGEVREAREEHASGVRRSASVDELMGEILS
ncbi:MAG TPA: hypothetical protein VF170_18855 [Planctomycetaceae bacterium]